MKFKRNNIFHGGFSPPPPAARLSKHAHMQTYAYELQKEVDFWVSGAHREAVSRKHASAGGGYVHAATEDGTPTNVGKSSSESIQETLPSPRRRRRGRVLLPESGGDDAVDRLVQSTTMSGDEEGINAGIFDRNPADEGRKATEGAPQHHSFERIETSSTTAATGTGRGWFWGAAT